jgi:hypothetical protein
MAGFPEQAITGISVVLIVLIVLIVLRWGGSVPLQEFIWASYCCGGCPSMFLHSVLG